MSVSVELLKHWLNTLNKNDSVGIDEDGLTLHSIEDYNVYHEVGGIEEEEEDKDSK